MKKFEFLDETYTIIVGFILYGTMPGANQIIGGIIIIASVFILNKDENNLAEKLEKIQ
jgi:drug/metabolite transporter (DMT)-like permease